MTKRPLHDSLKHNGDGDEGFKHADAMLKEVEEWIEHHKSELEESSRENALKKLKEVELEKERLEKERLESSRNETSKNRTV